MPSTHDFKSENVVQELSPDGDVAVLRHLYCFLLGELLQVILLNEGVCAHSVHVEKPSQVVEFVHVEVCRCRLREELQQLLCQFLYSGEEGTLSPNLEATQPVIS